MSNLASYGIVLDHAPDAIFFRAAFEGNPDATIICKWSDSRVVAVNPAFSRIYGYQPGEVLGKNARQISLWANPDDLERLLRELSRRGEVRAFEASLRAGNGTAIASEVTAVKLELGGEACVLAVMRDITRRKQAEAELARTRDAALEASRLRSAFLANTSHEIRTPLNVILGYTELIADYLDAHGDHSQDGYLEGVNRAGQRLLRTVEHVLDYSKLESGTFEVAPTALRLGPVVDTLVKDLGVLARAKGLELEARIDDPTVTLMFDERCMVGALTNLVQNAIKFTPAHRDGDKKGRVGVRLRRDRAGHLKLEICDTGIGIDKAYLPRLFEPFSREKSSYNRRFEGWGLGLALAKKYLEINGASLSVRSKKAAGTTFTVRFAPDSEVRQPSAAEAHPEPAARRSRPSEQSRPSLTVVEDDSDTQTFM